MLRLLKENKKLRRQHDVLVSQKQELERELKSYKYHWEPLANFMKDRNQNAVHQTVPEKIIEYIKFLEHVRDSK